MKINFSSTSFLPPTLSAWSCLKNFGKLKFLNYGELSNFKETGDLEISVIFFQDIINYYGSSEKIYKKNKDIIKNLIRLISSKKKTHKNYIICLSEYSYINTIENSKYFSQTKKLKNYFISKFFQLIKTRDNIFFLDLDDIFSNYGFNKCFDERNYFLTRCRLSFYGIEKLSHHLSQIIFRINNSSKKVLILDCDNTIWGGVLGEEGIDKISIGQDGIGMAYLEFQKAIIKVKNRGIILVLASKNDVDDVKNVLRHHQSMVIKEKDITSYKVNWNEKFKNIYELSKELFLGLNSFVFWDDNPIERKKVKLNLRDVEVVEPNEDISQWAKQLLELPSLSKFKVSKDDLNKTAQYKNRQKFLDKREKFKNEKEYLKSINIRAKILKLDKSNISRAEQLCMKTNQFNINIKRLNINDLIKINEVKDIFLVHLRDDYGDHGIISLVILGESKESIIIELFLMSCRILGRYLENWVLEKIRQKAIKKGKKFIIAEYLKTERNNIALKFLKENNFEKIKENEVSKIFKTGKRQKKYNYSKLSIKQKITNIGLYNE